MSRTVLGVAALLLCVPIGQAEEKKALSQPAVGQAAPDIEGEDIDGKSFRLHDYKGKVVVLDFWGNW